MNIAEFEQDFRRAAVSASVEKLRRADVANPLDAAGSLCLPTENGRTQLKAQMWLTLGSILAATLAFVGAGILITSQPEAAPDPIAHSVGLALGVTGLICLFLPTLCQGMVVRRHIGDRFVALKRNPDISGCFNVGIEDPATFSSIKIISDDVGYVGLDSTNRRLIIEGVMCQYIIHAEDIERFESRFMQASPGTEIEYRIDANTVLGITIEKLNFERNPCVSWVAERRTLRSRAFGRHSR